MNLGLYLCSCWGTAIASVVSVGGIIVNVVVVVVSGGVSGVASVIRDGEGNDIRSIRVVVGGTGSRISSGIVADAVDKVGSSAGTVVVTVSVAVIVTTKNGVSPIKASH